VEYKGQGKEFCELAFTLHGQQPEKDKQNVKVFLHQEKFLGTAMLPNFLRTVIRRKLKNACDRLARSTTGKTATQKYLFPTRLYIA